MRPVVVVSALCGLASITSAPEVHAEHRVELGVMAGAHLFNDENELGVPEGATDRVQRDAPLGGLRLSARLAARFGLEIELSALPTESSNGAADVSDLAYRASALLLLRPSTEVRLHPFVLAGGGAMSIIHTSNEMSAHPDTDPAFHAGVGAAYDLSSAWALRADARVLFPPSAGGSEVTTDFELLVSVSRCLAGCRDEAARPLPPPIERAPEPVVAPPPAPDSDGDKLADSADTCPSAAEDGNGFEDDDGCPDGGDDDNDGVHNPGDRCRTEAEDKDQFDDGDGCPDLDNDTDGIADASDRCATEAETANGFDDHDGCPDAVPVITTRTITFDAGKDAVPRRSHAALEDAVRFLQAHPIVRLSITGHTDERAPVRGRFVDNAALSLARADAVKAYLVGKGIAADRLETAGAGDSSPLQPGTSEAVRAANRRVELGVIGAPPTK